MSKIENITVKHDNDLKVFLSCECQSPDHTVIIQVYDWGDSMPYRPDFFIEVQATNYKPFHKRVWAAIKYIFGAELTWNDIIVQKEDVPKIQAAIDHYNKLLKNKEKKVVDKL